MTIQSQNAELQNIVQELADFYVQHRGKQVVYCREEHLPKLRSIMERAEQAVYGKSEMMEL